MAVVDTVSRAVGSIEQLTNSTASLAIGADNIHGRVSMELTSDNEAMSYIDDVPTVEGGNVLRPVPLTNGVLTEGINVNGYHKESIESPKIEKEEGELSPNGDFEEDNFVVYGDGGGSQVIPKMMRSSESMQYKAVNQEEICCQDAGGENNVDADDEDSENISQGEDVSVVSLLPASALRTSMKKMKMENKMRWMVKLRVRVRLMGCLMCALLEMAYHHPESFLRTVKPLAKHVTSALHDNEKKCSQILYERLLSAKLNSTAAKMKWRTAKVANPPDPYSRFMSALYNLLDGAADNAKFEDDCQAIIGNQSYVLFTLDKLIYKLVKQLQTVASDETDNKLIQLYEYEKSRMQQNYVDSVYYDNVHVVLHDENIYRFECSSAPSRLSIQLMDDGNDKVDMVAVSVDPNFVAYLHNDFLPVNSRKKEPSGIFLQRNKRKYADFDESSAICKAMEGACVVNGLECKMTCSSSKISYVLDTEDYFFRLKRRRNLSAGRSLCHYQTRGLANYSQQIEEEEAMGPDSILNASLPALSKDLGKKKRTNRLAKLKQSKLDARREQWLSQVQMLWSNERSGFTGWDCNAVKNEACKADSNDRGRSPPASLQIAYEGNRSKENIKLRSREVDAEGSSFHESDMDSLMSSSVSSSLGQHDSMKDLPGTSCSSASSMCFSGSVSEADEDDGCLDDWEAVADAFISR
ncbi:Paired amphipathic helix protein Sin3-like 2 [Camellia lanceoleosa]|uniref:Paired amphipathic helix protein Sin3-like 2 n=1 Tax=Camellia lanceoleosa TaxID=1840588 RepID=A0ACC0J420_9ERIC|nr:Paired amphipathic helix protein Sin3-like 2 [Camellia lanceoleosa]